mmetsp:Transcript_13249/g.35478  ORF Transcript_13249/g.35478 Transcript_13249/m.35478 type:complete len:224 (-) Transcript_13249:128-799(-)
MQTTPSGPNSSAQSVSASGLLVLPPITRHNTRDKEDVPSPALPSASILLPTIKDNTAAMDSNTSAFRTPPTTPLAGATSIADTMSSMNAASFPIGFPQERSVWAPPFVASASSALAGGKGNASPNTAGWWRSASTTLDNRRRAIWRCHMESIPCSAHHEAKLESTRNSEDSTRPRRSRGHSAPSGRMSRNCFVPYTSHVHDLVAAHANSWGAVSSLLCAQWQK